MADYKFAENIYIAPTPAGAFHAVSSPAKDPLRDLLLALLHQEETPKPVIGQLIDWTGASNVESTLSILQQAQDLAWIEGLEEPLILPTSGFGNMIEVLLASLSTSGKSLLVDDAGCAIARSGFDAETAEMLSALSADLVSIQDRHEKRLEKHFGLTIHGWGAMDSSGSSRIGTWPLYIGGKRLLIVILGEPRFNCSEFTLLIWSLIRRFSRSS